MKSGLSTSSTTSMLPWLKPSSNKRRTCALFSSDIGNVLLPPAFCPAGRRSTAVWWTQAKPGTWVKCIIFAFSMRGFSTAAFDLAPTLDQGERRSPPYRLGQLRFCLPPQGRKLIGANHLQQPTLERHAELKRQAQIGVARF